MEERSFDELYDDKVFRIANKRGGAISSAETPTLYGGRANMYDLTPNNARSFALSPRLQAAASYKIGDSMSADNDSYHLRYSYQPTANSNKIGDARKFY